MTRSSLVTQDWKGTEKYATEWMERLEEKQEGREISPFSQLLKAIFVEWSKQKPLKSAGRYEAEFAKIANVPLKTLRNWLDSKTHPQRGVWETTKSSLRTILSDEKIELLDESWRMNLQKAAGPQDQKIDTAEISSTEKTSFLLSKLSRETPYPNLVDIALDQPPQGSTSDDFYLIVTLSFGLMHFIDAAVRAELGVRRATVFYQSENCHFASGTRFGQNPRRPGVDPDNGASWIFANSESPDLPLRGDQLKGEPLGRVQGDGQGTPALSITVQCAEETDLFVQIKSPRRQRSQTQRKIAERFLQKCLQDDNGLFRLAQAGLKWNK